MLTSRHQKRGVGGRGGGDEKSKNGSDRFVAYIMTLQKMPCSVWKQALLDTYFTKIHQLGGIRRSNLSS